MLSAQPLRCNCHGEEKSTTNAAERECIAYALAESTEATFVTADRRAALRIFAGSVIGRR